MPFLTYNNIGISGISACVPKKNVSNQNLEEPLTGKLLDKTIKTTGIFNRRIADKNICASDLCYESAKELIHEMEIDKNSIDFVIFVTQTPDYILPATAPILQHRLGLKQSIGAFVVNLGCSGYVYGLSIAFAYASLENINRVLLLSGDTPSKFVSPKDKTTGILFGDGGSATIIEKKKNSGKSHFSLNSDGAGHNALKINAGAYRCPSTPETLEQVQHDDGSIRNEEQLTMDGASIFNFTIRQIPKDIKALLEYSETTLDEIDYIFFHQANKFITDHLTKKLKYPIEQVPYSLKEFGNTSCLSIPLTIATQIETNRDKDAKKIILSGFGVGLSWATAIINLKNCCITKIIEV